MKYTENYRVALHDLDINGIASASAVMRRMEEAAGRQYAAAGMPLGEMRNNNRVFILSKTCLSLYRPLYENDLIGVQTWAAESKGYSFNRCGRILRKDEIIAEWIAVFALIDPRDRRLLRVEDNPPPVETEEMLELDIPRRVLIPADLPMALRGEHTVSYADCDRNFHMNNTVYADLLCGFLPEMRERRVISLLINFLREAPLGTSFKVYHGENDGSHCFRTVLEDGKKGVEAQLLLDTIE